MNQSKNIIIGIISIIVLAGIVWFVRPASPSAAGVLVAGESSFDFGAISMKNGKVSRVFNLKNNGEDSITIKKIYTSCMCTSAEVKYGSGKKYGPFGMPGHGGSLLPANIMVGAGETIELKAIFDPTAHGPSGVGFAKRIIYLETDSEKTPKIELEISAMVTK